MANVSVPKVIWVLIYLAVPAFLLISPDVVLEYIPEDFQKLFVPAVILVFFFIGMIFVRSQKKLLATIVMVLAILGALAFVVYSNWDNYSQRMDEVHAHYQVQKGEYYDTESTEFQAKVGQVVPLAIDSIDDIAKYLWIAVAVPMLLLGLLGLRGVIEFAAIPKSHNKNTYSDKDIPENIEAQTNRPTAEQRAAKLEAIKGSSTSKPHQPIQNTMAPDDTPIVPPISPSFQTTAPKSGVIMPNWQSDGNGDPVIKANNTPTPETVIPSPFTIPNAAPAQPVQPVQQPVYTAPVQEAPAQPVYTAPVQPVQPVQPVYTAPVQETPVQPVQPAQPVYTAPVQEAPAQPETPAEPANPFASFNPFGQTQPEEPKAPAQEAAPAEPVNPFAGFNPFPVKEEPKPVEPAPVKVVLTPQPTIIPTATVTPAQTRAAAKTTAAKEQISDDEKARIKDLQQQVSELKTLYNQGMITQDEYITQRTALLQQMYSK